MVGNVALQRQNTTDAERVPVFVDGRLTTIEIIYIAAQRHL